MLLKLAIRNLIRNRRRTVLTGLTMVAGFVTLAFTLGLTEGGYDRIIAMFTDLNTGHVQLLHRETLDDPSLYKTVKDPKGKIAAIEKAFPTLNLSSRIEGGGLGFFGDVTIGVRIIGVDRRREARVSSIDLRRESGHWFKEDGQYEALIGALIAEQLEAKQGDKIAIISQGADGSISSELFKVIGIMKKNGVDDYSVFTDLVSAQEYFSLYNRVHRIVIKSNHFSEARGLQEKLRQKIPLPDSEVFESWEAIEREFVVSMEADKEGNNILYFIIGIAVSLGVLNTVLMSILERRKEFGIIKAIGTRPSLVFRMIMAESLMLSACSCFIGFIIAFAINSYFATNGIKFPEPVELGGILMDEMVSTVGMRAFIPPFLVIFISAVTVTIIPALRAAQAKPSDAMRAS